MSARSYLYVPADRPEMLANAADRGADALIVDLEDAVAPSRKIEARRALSNFLPGPTQTWVRVNNHPDLLADDVAACAGAAGIVVAKAEPETLSQVVSITSLPITPLIWPRRRWPRSPALRDWPSARPTAELGITPGAERPRPGCWPRRRWPRSPALRDWPSARPTSAQSWESLPAMRA